MTERELKLLLGARAVKQVQVHYAVMSRGSARVKVVVASIMQSTVAYRDQPNASL